MISEVRIKHDMQEKNDFLLGGLAIIAVGAAAYLAGKFLNASDTDQDWRNQLIGNIKAWENRTMRSGHPNAKKAVALSAQFRQSVESGKYDKDGTFNRLRRDMAAVGRKIDALTQA